MMGQIDERREEKGGRGGVKRVGKHTSKAGQGCMWLDYVSQRQQPTNYVLDYNPSFFHLILILTTSQKPPIITKMSAPASADDAENVTVIDAYPRDVIIQYIIKPTMVDHPIVYVLFLCFLVLLADGPGQDRGDTPPLYYCTPFDLRLFSFTTSYLRPRSPSYWPRGWSVSTSFDALLMVQVLLASPCILTQTPGVICFMGSPS